MNRPGARVTPPPLPDLTIDNVDGCQFFFSGGDIALSDRNPSPGDSVTVTASIRNAGSADAVAADAQLLRAKTAATGKTLKPNTRHIAN